MQKISRISVLGPTHVKHLPQWILFVFLLCLAVPYVHNESNQILCHGQFLLVDTNHTSKRRVYNNCLIKITVERSKLYDHKKIVILCDNVLILQDEYLQTSSYILMLFFRGITAYPIIILEYPSTIITEVTPEVLETYTQIHV